MGVLLVCAAIFVLEFVSPELRNAVFLFGAQINPAVAVGQWYRLFTAAFLHADMMHILFNMWALYLFGPHLERQAGSVAFAALYLGSAAAGGAAFYLLEPSGVAVGASGAIFGLFGAWLAAAYRNRHTAWGRSGFQQLLLLLGINLALPLVVDNIAWQAHLGGLVAGMLIVGVWGLSAVRGTVHRALVGLGVAVVSLAAVLVV
jgi:membrane associated rhomboid family serine protease